MTAHPAFDVTAALFVLMWAFGAAIHAADILTGYQSGLISGEKTLIHGIAMATVIAVLVDIAVQTLTGG